MKRTKRGFTLIEMMLVVAIVVILSAVGFAAVADTLQKQKKKQEQYQIHTDIMTSAQNGVLRDSSPLKGVPTANTPVPNPVKKDENTGDGGGGGGDGTPTSTPTPTEVPTEVPVPTDPPPGGGTLDPELVPSPTPTEIPTEIPTDIPKEDKKVDEHVTVIGGLTEKDGVKAAKLNGDGSYTIELYKPNGNGDNATVTLNINLDGSMTISGSKYVLSGHGFSFSNDDLYNKTIFYLSDKDIEVLKNDWNLQLDGFSTDGPPPSTGGSGGSSGSSDPITSNVSGSAIGSVSVPSGITNSGPGVREYKEKSDGTIDITFNDGSNGTEVTINLNDGTITIKSNEWMFQNKGFSFGGDLYNGNPKIYTLTSDDKALLKTLYGIEIS
ncbi:MAG: prepilin-type N-terminal cleavage/methylation domain-containing protein [Saccharofermentans sp.]|nr:prepilin-type N-terminal cleavage/methylation domain-containing protein [Saccharofermentans sp.]